MRSMRSVIGRAWAAIRATTSKIATEMSLVLPVAISLPVARRKSEYEATAAAVTVRCHDSVNEKGFVSQPRCLAKYLSVTKLRVPHSSASSVPALPARSLADGLIERVRSVIAPAPGT